MKNPFLWLLGGLAFVLVLSVARVYFSPEARARRRREKSHQPVISRRSGPAVRLAVKVDEPKRDREH